MNIKLIFLTLLNQSVVQSISNKDIIVDGKPIHFRYHGDDKVKELSFCAYINTS